VFFAGNAASRDAINQTVKIGDLQRVVRALEREKAKPISEIITAGAGIGTHPVEAAFFALCHSDLVPDIRNITGFVPVSEYASRGDVVPGEIGTVQNIRFVRATYASPWLSAGLVTSTTFLQAGIPPSGAGACDIYPILIFGRDAFAFARLQGRTAASISVLNPNTPSHSDPAGQRGSVTWKTFFGGAITANEHMARLEVACTAVPA
jgi:N4-gp56 family major capsid protein